MPIAVLTGDIVASTTLPAEQQEAIMDALRQAANDAEAWHGVDLSFTRQKGDGWQVVLARPALALRTALYFQSAVRALGKGLSTRVSIATGAGDPGAGPDLNSANGPAFIASGRGLEAQAADRRISHATVGALAAVVGLADHISQGWTPAQAKAIHPMLAPHAPPRHSDVALDLGISRQAVTQALDAASFAALSEALTQIEADNDGQ